MFNKGELEGMRDVGDEHLARLGELPREELPAHSLEHMLEAQPGEEEQGHRVYLPGQGWTTISGDWCAVAIEKVFCMPVLDCSTWWSRRLERRSQGAECTCQARVGFTISDDDVTWLPPICGSEVDAQWHSADMPVTAAAEEEGYRAISAPGQAPERAQQQSQGAEQKSKPAASEQVGLLRSLAIDGLNMHRQGS